MQPKQITGSTIYHLELSQDMDYEFKFVYVDESTLLPIDLTGYTAELQMKLAYGSPTVLRAIRSTGVCPEGKIDMDASGLITVTINGPFTYGVTWDSGVYDLVLVTPQGRRLKLIRGKINIFNTISSPSIDAAPQYADKIITVGNDTVYNVWGFKDPISQGLPIGALVGDLRPDQFWGPWRVTEVSWSNDELRIVFLGIVPETYPEELSIGSVWFSFRGATRLVDADAVYGLGLTKWTWATSGNPFGTLTDVQVPFKIYGTNTLPADTWSTRQW